MSRRLLVALAFLVGGRSAAAQYGRAPLTQAPVAWVAGGFGLGRLGAVADGSTNSLWEFGQALAYSAALEAEVGNGLAVGAAGSYGSFPLLYQSYDFTAGVPLATGPCPNGCNAHATVWTAVADVHVGGGTGFHQVIEGGLGAQGYTRFADDASGARLPPTRDVDVFFRVGYGFGVTVSPRLEVDLVQDYGQSLHHHDRLPGNVRTANESYLTRVTVRLGLGAKRS